MYIYPVEIDFLQYITHSSVLKLGNSVSLYWLVTTDFN